MEFLKLSQAIADAEKLAIFLDRCVRSHICVSVDLVVAQYSLAHVVVSCHGVSIRPPTAPFCFLSVFFLRIPLIALTR